MQGSSGAGGTAASTNPLDDAVVRQHMACAVRGLLRIRPEDPMEFLADYFTHVTTGIPAVQRAYKLIKYAANKPPKVLRETIAEAYTLLSVNQQHTLDRPYGSLRTRHKVPAASEGGGKKRRKSRYSSTSKPPNGLTSVPLSPPRWKQVTQSLSRAVEDRNGLDAVLGQDFMQLLGMLTSDFSPQVSEAICSRYMCADRTVVSWPHFLEALSLCQKYADLLRQGRELFLVLDPLNTGLAPQDICQQVIDFLVLDAPPTSEQMAALDAAFASAATSATSRHQSGGAQDSGPTYVSLGSFLQTLSLLFLEVSAPNQASATTIHSQKAADA